MELGVEVRPVWSMSGSEMLTALDTLHTTMASLQTYRLQILAGIDQVGYAKDVGARDTIQLLAFRHRLDQTQVRRDLKLATALPKYQTVTAALPDPFAPTTPDGAVQYADTTPEPSTTTGTDTGADIAVAAAAGADPAAAGPAGNAADPAATAEGAAGGADAVLPVLLHPSQAEAIVSALEKVPATAMVPVEDLLVAEETMVEAGRHLGPGDLRRLVSRSVTGSTPTAPNRPKTTPTAAKPCG